MLQPFSKPRLMHPNAVLLALALAGLPAAHPATAADPAPAPPPGSTRFVDYFIVVTGEELLRGVYPDSHTHFLTRTLRPMGGRCAGSMTVDDHPDDLKAALAFATRRAPLVLVTGGLGPTSNDITRDTLADFTGGPLREDPQVLADMERRFNTPREKLRENLRRQTRVPVRGGYLKNPNGSAVGLVFEATNTLIVALPGPPRELQPMVTNELVTLLRQKYGVHPPGTSLTLRFVGVGQSQVDQVLRDHVPVDSDIFVSSLFEGSRVDFTFALPGNSAEDRARLQRLERQLLEHLNEYFYADDDRSLEQTVAAAIRARGGSLVLLEIASGGNLADNLGRVDHASELLAGAYVATSEARLRQLLRVPDPQWTAWPAGGERLKELGRVALRGTQCSWAVVVGEVQRPADGSPFCWVAWGFPNDRWEVQQLAVRGSGDAALAGLTTQILDRWRRALR